MVAKGHNLRDDGLVGPINAENLCKLLQIVSRRLADGEDGVAEPAHAKVCELFVEELNTELTGKEGDIFDDS